LACLRELGLQHRLDLGGSEKESVPRLPQHAEIAAGIVEKHDGEMDVVFVVLFYRLDDGDLAGESKVKNVSACTRPEPHTAADA
jgi:hypothetical protein